MVGWYDPFQLLRTGKDVLVSALLGTRADYRLLESFDAQQGIFDDCAKEPEIWIDYVADVGDGWNSTYAIASLLAAPSLALSTVDGKSHAMKTERGRILVMGGDEVYPTAGRKGYQERTVGPYACALRESSPPHPALFAIPGNHDWYDGLVSFSRLFCQERWIGGWKTRQRRSYFAIRLPHRWWLWGVDIQLESDIDQPQLDYFRRVADHDMQEGDRVILATAEPHWVYGNIYGQELQSNLAFLEEKVIARAKAKVLLMLAGDLHHYRRHEATDGSQKQLITSGGGGAFLHPTFGPSVDQVRVGRPPGVSYSLKSEFPDRRISKRLLSYDLLFPLLNPRFGLLTGLLYLALGRLLLVALQGQLVIAAQLTLGGLWRAVVIGLLAALGSPGPLLLVLAVIGGFVLFTDTHNKAYRWIAGALHGLAHLVAVVIVSWMAAHSTFKLFGSVEGSLGALWACMASLFLGGYFAGAVLMGIYLYVSLRFFRRHSNEAFSALHIADYKNFVRLHIDRRGQLTIFPIGVQKVPRAWGPSDGADGPCLVPAGGARIEASLIERPITIGV